MNGRSCFKLKIVSRSFKKKIYKQTEIRLCNHIEYKSAEVSLDEDVDDDEHETEGKN